MILGGANTSGILGVANLTTVGAIPYVSATGTLNQAPTGLFYDSANGYLIVGSNTGKGKVNGVTDFGSATAFTSDSQNNFAARNLNWGVNNWLLNRYDSAAGVVAAGSGVQITDQSLNYGDFAWFTRSAAGFSEKLRIKSNGNVLIGTSPTDGNYKLDVQASGSSGTLRVYDQTVTTGSTSLVVRAGAGQSGNLTTWQNAAGATMAAMPNGGGFETATAVSIAESSSALRIYNAGLIKWSSTGLFSGSADTGLARVSGGGVIEINNGTAGMLRDLNARYIVSIGGYVDSQAWRYRLGNRGDLIGQSDGVWTLFDTANTSFGRLQFGGTTSSFPALKRSSAILQVRLADDSANTQIQASRFISDQTTPSASTDAGTAGAIWADATYLYVQTAAGTIKRVTLNAF